MDSHWHLEMILVLLFGQPSGIGWGYLKPTGSCSRMSCENSCLIHCLYTCNTIQRLNSIEPTQQGLKPDYFWWCKYRPNIHAIAVWSELPVTNNQDSSPTVIIDLHLRLHGLYWALDHAQGGVSLQMKHLNQFEIRHSVCRLLISKSFGYLKIHLFMEERLISQKTAWNC